MLNFSMILLYDKTLLMSLVFISNCRYSRMYLARIGHARLNMKNSGRNSSFDIYVFYFVLVALTLEEEFSPEKCDDEPEDRLTVQLPVH